MTLRTLGVFIHLFHAAFAQAGAQRASRQSTDRIPVYTSFSSYRLANDRQPARPAAVRRESRRGPPLRAASGAESSETGRESKIEAGAS